jgi:hypothetical protein
MDDMLFQRGLLLEVFVSSQGYLFLFLLSILPGQNTRCGAVCPGSFVLVLTLEGKCLRRRAKPAHLEGHLPHTSSGYFPCQLASSLATLKPSYKRESVLFWREEPVQQSFVSSREQERQQKGLSGKVCRIPPPDEPYKNRQSV